ncbi:thioesterase family protein [Zunongwangia sp. F363]|uniref:Thioesterase family protein n=1 Tax=Autumnicola tepida TaxID=3075595 RepID=A0ABU3CC30_9FLAO|nr:thioesterase family protein [Zunongwangia sp. F363]MDT0643898.1 thioesterase family protein [Zunongwangia sp. F363]
MAATQDIFEQKIRVKPEHLDEQQHVNNVQYVQWVQDVAKAHWLHKSTLKQQEDFFWVVVEHVIKYKQQAFLDEELILETYVGETTHVTSVRHVNIKNANTGKVLVEAKTTWCLMNKDTKKISKISEELKQVFLR